MTTTEAYAQHYREWKRSRDEKNAALARESACRRIMESSWRDVKTTVSPGLFRTSLGIVVVGGEDYPEPQQVFEEREMHPCRICPKGQGPCRCATVNAFGDGYSRAITDVKAHEPPE